MNTVVATREQALQAVEQAAWDEYNSALSGSDIWGAHGQFASQRATSHYTYDRAVAEVDAHFPARQYILAAIENDRAALVEGIKFIFNCREASVDDDGSIWIEGPQRGHWLSDDDLARVNRELREGRI